MANVSQIRMKPVSITLDKQRSLMYDLNAYAELEEIYGSVNAAIEALQSGSMKAIRAILWAGLIHEEMDENGAISLKQLTVGKMLGLADIESISELIAQAIYNTMPEADAEATEVNQAGQ